jgi:glycine oxidase
VVNCAGAWSGQLSGIATIPTRPVKGHMLDIIPAQQLAPHTTTSGSGEGVARKAAALLRHVVRSADVYLVPRSDGRIVIGSTVEDVGYDKRVVIGTIQRLHQAAANLVPELGEARIHESWTGLRPGSPDGLPILGATAIPGYFVATGHYRDGILLAPITAQVMAQLIAGQKPDCDLLPFSPSRFDSAAQH